MATKRWKIKPSAPAEILERLIKDVKVNPVIANLLWQRGVATYDEAKLFFRPQLEHLHDPFLMKDMDKAIARIEKAIKNGEKILVYGDYDVDGTTSVALVYSFFKHYLSPSLPSREGVSHPAGEKEERIWNSIFNKFENQRKPDSDAIAELAIENYIEMRDKVADHKFW